jgi:hypothetical protein
MKLRQEVLDAMVELSQSENPGCQCQVPMANPPCGWCTHPGNPAALDHPESWESEADFDAFWVEVDRAGALLNAAGLRRATGDWEWNDLDRGFCVGHGWDEDTNEPMWYARSLDAKPAWRQEFGTVEAALVYGVTQAALSEPKPYIGWDKGRYFKEEFSG